MLESCTFAGAHQDREWDASGVMWASTTGQTRRWRFVPCLPEEELVDNDIYSEAGRRIEAIEAEMRRIGFWRDVPPPSEAFTFTQPFAMDTMTFTSWLQFIFIPRVQEIIAKKGTFPRSSQVSAQAVREFDGIDEASELVTMLSEFDTFIEEL